MRKGKKAEEPKKHRKRERESPKDVEIALEQGVELQVGREGRDVWISEEGVEGYKFTDVLGSGTSGTVYKAKSPKKGKGQEHVAIKVLFSDENFWPEVELAQEMSELGVGPQFIDAWEAEGLGFLATDKWDTSLRDYQHLKNLPYKSNQPIPPHIIYKLKVMINNLHKAGYVHGDILEKNILVQVDPKTGKITDIVLTDFGLMQTIEKWKNAPEFLQTMLVTFSFLFKFF